VALGAKVFKQPKHYNFYNDKMCFLFFDGFFILILLTGCIQQTPLQEQSKESLGAGPNVSPLEVETPVQTSQQSTPQEQLP